MKFETWRSSSSGQEAGAIRVHNLVLVACVRQSLPVPVATRKTDWLLEEVSIKQTKSLVLVVVVEGERGNWIRSARVRIDPRWAVLVEWKSRAVGDWTTTAATVPTIVGRCCFYWAAIAPAMEWPIIRLPLGSTIHSSTWATVGIDSTNSASVAIRKPIAVPLGLSTKPITITNRFLSIHSLGLSVWPASFCV